ncbi:efflux RND transporter periplasmic adaptor subunit [Pseudoalteromonas byunsanensis]|uniref:Efflux transporter periplasmic adaptor subunit n=1 Tax=Pseudoalteromonas byunsanensis TaxID=327939 RepID=A0A1S1N8U6_9GAMM|nr:efflux RND transporter periplasmic adaptor subunit [Pseudoalteromonas byunsanensis]OHU97422.1 efflux transporter periplasmic adaptor subunit [Pseudoalteromonas byunsanensis]OHU97822.1 efflux transporter periplasmic adaptor subunit [Pseudoalteromonas byunsanensis]
MLLSKKHFHSYKTVVSVMLLTFAVAVTTPASAKSPVSVETVSMAPLKSSLLIHGTLYGKQDVTLTAGVGGLLTFVVEPGSIVIKGDILARIDTLPLELEQARQQEMLNRAQINLQFHKQELMRLTQLAKTSSAAASQVDRVKQQHDLAHSDIQLAKIELRLIADKIERSTLKAPFSGVISERFSHSGQDVNRADKLVRLIDIHNLEARLYVPVKYLSSLDKGLTLPIAASNSNISNHVNTTITAIIPATDPRSQSFEVRATLPKQTGQHWAAGQLVDVSLPLSSGKSELLVNRDALILRKQGVHVVRINKDNKAEQIPVEVGKGQGKYVSIKPLGESVLEVGDSIAVRGAERLSTGQEVEIQTSSTVNASER